METINLLTKNDKMNNLAILWPGLYSSKRTPYFFENDSIPNLLEFQTKTNNTIGTTADNKANIILKMKLRIWYAVENYG